jgi:hypothetical protein
MIRGGDMLGSAITILEETDIIGAASTDLATPRMAMSFAADA